MVELDSHKRLSAIRGGMLLSSADAELQRLVEAAADTASAPIALVSLVMGTIQFFRAQVGLPHELGVSRATNRCDSFCQYVVETEQVFIVTDATQDGRVPQALVRDYGVQAYAGAPLRVQGEVVGSLCVIDVKPRDFGAAVLTTLRSLAAEVSDRLEVLSIIPFDDADLTPEQELSRLIADQSNAIARAFVELRPTLQLAQSAGVMSGDELKRGLQSLSATHTLLDFVDEALRELSVHTERLKQLYVEDPKAE